MKNKPSSIHIDDLVRPIWFEKIMKQLELDKNRPLKPNCQKYKTKY